MFANTLNLKFHLTFELTLFRLSYAGQHDTCTRVHSYDRRTEVYRFNGVDSQVILINLPIIRNSFLPRSQPKSVIFEHTIFLFPFPQCGNYFGSFAEKLSILLGTQGKLLNLKIQYSWRLKIIAIFNPEFENSVINQKHLYQHLTEMTKPIKQTLFQLQGIFLILINFMEFKLVWRFSSSISNSTLITQ